MKGTLFLRMAAKYPQWLTTEAARIWKTLRPIPVFETADLYYVEIVKITYEVLAEIPFHLIGFEPDRVALVELAALYTAYFEDFISEAGLWKAFIEHNLAEMGRYLPFYDLEDYDPEYINWQDLNYIIWVWAGNLHNGKFVDPLTGPLQDVARDLLDELEMHIDEAPACTVYDKFLEVKPTDHWMHIRVKLEWLGFGSYLFGLLDCQYAFLDAVKDLERQQSELFKSAGTDLVYDVKMDLVYTRVSKICGLRIPEIGAKILRASPEILDSIAASSPRWLGEFELLRSDAQVYRLRHTDTDREIDVARASSDLDGHGRNLIISHIVKWRDLYWFTGMVSQGFVGPRIPRKKVHPVPNILQTAAEKAEMQSLTANLESLFLKIFGSHFRLFPDRKSLAEGLQSLNAAATTAYGKGDLGDAMKGYAEPKLTAFPPGTPLGLFFHPGVGQMISQEAAAIVSYLQTGDAEHQPSAYFFSLFGRMPKAFVQYVIENFQIDALQSGFITLDIKSNWIALCRHLNPAGNAKPTPAVMPNA